MEEKIEIRTLANDDNSEMDSHFYTFDIVQTREINNMSMDDMDLMESIIDQDQYAEGMDDHLDQIGQVQQSMILEEDEDEEMAN